jgi:hypothetical protein
VCHPRHFFEGGAGNVPRRCVWRGLGVPLSCREGRIRGLSDLRVAVSVAVATLAVPQFTVGDTSAHRRFQKGILPTMQQICSDVGATLPYRAL